MQFQLTEEYAINGERLAQEIQAATGLDVFDRYAFIAPDTIEIGGEDIEPLAVAIQALVTAHDSTLLPSVD